ncbi:MAG TPA: amino acid adenylation domain-containing protein, partial [Gaiellaceae bacterium]
AETRLERELVRAWKEVLEVDDVSAEDSFLALGGDSVRAMQVAARLWRRLDVRVPVRLLVDASSLAEVAAGLAASGEASAPELEARSDDRAPAAPGAERLFVLAEAQPASAAAYNVHLAVRLAGPLHVDALVASLERLVARHDALRTRLEATPAGVQAVVGPPAAPEIVRVRATEEELEALLGRAAARPFDLGAPPLLRASLFTLAPEDHVLLLVAPHAVVDGWSLGVLGDDLSALYQALRDGQEPPEPPALRHLDACRWQRSRTDEATEALAYWLRQLDGAPQDVDLVLDHGRPPVPSYRGGRVARRFPASLVRRLEEIGRENEATLYPCLLAAYAALLGRAAGQEELLIATPASDRPLPELERVVGFFVDTLVLRVDLSGRPSFAELVAHARGVLLEGLDHAPVPFDRLVADLAAARDPSRHPLVSVAFAYQGRRPVPRLPGVESRLVPVDNGAAKFDLLLDVEEAEDGSVVATLEYADLFERETAELLLDRLERLLEACAASPAARVDAVSLVAPEERRALLAPAARPASPPDACLHELLAARARANPKAPAVVCGGSSLTYGELVGQAGPLAQSLRAQGVGPEERVGICLERSCELVVAIAGVLEAGAAYVPLDPALPPERLRAIVEDAGIRVVVATPDLRELLPAEVTVVAPDAPAPATLAAPARVSPEAAAYVIYTSGSTGRPKGVVVTHANIVRLFEATEDFGFSERDVWTLFHSFAFDFSVWELWGALLHGGRLVVVPALTARAPAELLELLRCERVTVLNQTPTAFRLLQAAAAEDGFPPLSLRLVVFGGEALDPRSLRPWVEAYGERTRLVNMYGITETTVHVTARPLETADVTAAVSPIGEPLPDLQLLVLDERLEPVAPGMPGELHVSGPGVARGYLDRPRETAARFLPNPYGATGGRLYRSGDVAVRTLDGELLYLGRDDSQVKLRGHRIELGEIEAVLHEHPEVRDAVATLRALPAGEDGLVAYVVTNGTEPDPRELRRFVEVRLPQYMVPAAFVPLPRLPLTANGKLDARALPEPDGNGVSVSEHVAPRTETERQLAEIWSQLLGVERVGADDNFFALGGDSILSVRLAAEAAERGLGFSLEDVFLRPTLAALAEATTRADEPKLPEPEPEPMLPSAFPLTSLQLALVYDSELNPGAYRDLAGVTVRGPLDTAALANALSALCARHELLRVSLDLEGDDSPRHIVHERVQPTFEHADVRLATDADAELDRVRADLLRPFDWQRAPLLRCLVTRRSDATFQLDLAVHHAILDGWSLARVLSDLLLLYARELGDDVELPALPPVSYAELVRLEREALASPADGAFWRRSLDGAGASLQPGSGALGEIRRVAVPLDTETVERLQAQAARAGLPLKSVALAAHLAGLAAVTGSSDVVTGVVVDARPEVAGADRLAGLYLNVVALRADVRRDLLETARAAYAAEADLLPHRRFPAVEIRRLGAASNTLFNYAHFHLYRELERLRSVRVLDWTYVDRNTVPFTLDVLVDSLPDQVSLRFAFDPGAVDEDAALSLVDAVERALTDAAPARVRTSPVPVAGAS